MTEQLVENEKLVLGIIRNYLNMNRSLDPESIIPFIQSRLRESSVHLTYYAIELIIKSLLNQKLIVKASKLTHDDILTNEKRKLILNYIRENPGTHFNKIITELKISNHVVVWHLNMLLKFNFLKKEIIDDHETYSIPNVDSKTAELSYYISKAKSQKIISYLRENDIGVSKTKLSEDLQMHINTINKYLTILEDFKIIVKEHHSKKLLYFLNDEFKMLLF
jgi:predicted transcriptional regulator